LSGADGSLRDWRADRPDDPLRARRRPRLSASRTAVRCAGLDIGVHRSGRRSRAGKLTRQGSPQLRWALYESASRLPTNKPRPRPTTWNSRSAGSHTPERP
jgi:transposase